MRKDSGFTLIELMIVVAIAATLLSMAIPNFRDFVLRARITNTANSFAASVNLARGQAAKQGTPVYLTALNGTWADGWMVWKESDGNQTYDAATDEILRTETLEEGLTMTSPSALTQLRFSPSGRVGNSGTLVLCDSRTGESGRELIINSIGRLTVSRRTCS